MDSAHSELIDTLQTQIQPVAPEDTMAAAGRKVLLDQFVKMLLHEAGSRSGEDIIHVHDMRVATRRSRSALLLLEDYYKPKQVRTYRSQLQKIARALGAVRNLDVIIPDLEQFQMTMDEKHQADLQAVIEKLDAQRTKARKNLNKILDKADYRRFVDNYSAFLTHQSKSHEDANGAVQPTQIRHILPGIIYQHLGAARAYDTVLSDADLPTLHALRIELKRLRYAVSLFSDVLGSSIKEFVKPLKAMQDHLGRMQDIATTQAILNPMVSELSDGQGETLQLYLDRIEAECQDLRQQFPELWRHFNTKTVQKQLANAVVAL